MTEFNAVKKPADSCLVKLSALSGSKILLAMLLISAAYIRINHLGFRSLWLDEAVLYWIANNPLKDVLIQNAAQNSAPPLFAVLLHMVMTFGQSEAVLRSVSCAAGIAAVYAIYLLACRFMDKSYAMFAALLVAISPQQVYYSQQLREYSLAFLLAVCLLGAFTVFQQNPSLKKALVLGLIMFVALLTQYGLALLILVLSLICLICFFTRDDMKQCLVYWVIANLIGLVGVFFVYILALKNQFDAGGFGAQYLSGGYWDHSWPGILHLLKNTESILQFSFPGIVMLLLCFLGILECFRARTTGHKIALAYLCLPLLLVLVMALMNFYPYLAGRQIIVFTPMLYVFAALGLVFLSKTNARNLRPVMFVLIAWAVVSGGYAVNKLYMKPIAGSSIENLRPVVRQLQNDASPADIIYVYYGSLPAFRYYMRGSKLQWVAGASYRNNISQYFRDLDPFIAKQKKIWLVFSHLWGDEVRQIIQYLQARGKINIIVEAQGAYLVQFH